MIIWNDHKPLARFLNGKNANNRVNRWGLELETYNITFKWISGAHNKAADCLSRLVDLPHDRQATVQMLPSTNHDGPAFHTRSRTEQSNMTENLTSHPKTDTATPDITNISDTPYIIPKLLTKDRLQALQQMQRTDPFCQHISNGTALKHEVDHFLHMKGLLYKHVTDSNQIFLDLVKPKSWKYTVLVEAHDKVGHQGATHTYCLIKHQYYWKSMNKDIRKYIANSILYFREKAKVQSYPLQMTEIPEWPFDKIAINLVTECETSISGNKYILTIIDHLTGWLEAFPIPDKSADTIVSTFINQYLPVHMCLRYILSDSGTELKNQLMDQVLQQLDIGHIFSTPYHPQNNRKLEVSHRYLRPTLKKLCEKDPANCDKDINQVLTSYRVTPSLVTSRNTIFLVYGRDPSLPLHRPLDLMQWFLSDPESGLLNLKSHLLALAIAKKLLMRTASVQPRNPGTENHHLSK